MLRSLGVVALAGVLVGFSPEARAGELGRIGVYDLWQIEQVLPPEPRDDKFRGPEGDVLRKEIRRLSAELKAVSDDLEDSERLRRESEISRLRRELYALKPSGTKEARRGDARIKAALMEYGQKNGFTVLLERKEQNGNLGAVLPMTTGVDITADIIRMLGASPEKAAALRAARTTDFKVKENAPIE